MRSKKVTETWEFYRDNCPGFKEPMRKKMRELDEYVADLEKVAKELWLLLMFTGNDDAYAEIGFSDKKAVIDAYKLRDRMVDLGIVLPQVPMSDDDLIDYLSEELGIEVPGGCAR